VASALASEQLAGFISSPISKFAFTAALMHDIGKLLLSRLMEQKVLDEIMGMVERDKIAYVDAEHRVLGTDHAEVGGRIARHWDFPEPLVMAIELHHDPDVQPDLLMDIVHISNTAAKVIGVGLGTEQMYMKVSNQSHKRLGMTASDLELLCVTIQEELASAEQIFSGESHGT
jgi:putative nucleotidyltransferase with HDIG domain